MHFFTRAIAPILLVLRPVMSQDNNSDDDDFCPFPRCLQDGASYCAGDSLSTIIIMRCPTDNSTSGGATGACPQPANCKANLAGLPPYGSKQDALCWQESETAGNAQCVRDCVSVKLLNGTEFYPVGCSFKIENGTGTPSSVILNLPSPTTTTGTAPSQATPSESSRSGGSSFQAGITSAHWGTLLLVTSIGIGMTLNCS